MALLASKAKVVHRMIFFGFPYLHMIDDLCQMQKFNNALTERGTSVYILMLLVHSTTDDGVLNINCPKWPTPQQATYCLPAKHYKFVERSNHIVVGKVWIGMEWNQHLLLVFG